ERLLERARGVALRLHQHGSGEGLVERPHVRGGRDEHTEPAGVGLGGEAIDERGLAARPGDRDDVPAADAQGVEDHGPVYPMTNRPPVMSLATIRFEPGKMYAPHAPLKPPEGPGYVS